MSIVLEVCVDSIESAVAARDGGADRLEVCSSLAAEGTTPSYGLVKRCVDDVKLPVMMMIRPHDGGFVYSDADIEVMLDDIEMGRSLGVRGFVFGILTSERDIHVEQCRRLLAATGNRQTTFHRAFDVVREPMNALDQIVELGFDRLLTSGQAPTAMDGAELIQKLHEQAGNRIVILAGAGVRPENAKSIVGSTGIRELHASAAVDANRGQSVNQVSFGNFQRVCCSKTVQAIRRSLMR